MEKFAKRVLIVDDEEDITWTITRRLSKDNHEYEVLSANSGKDALGILNMVPVDMVITDVRMPEISGLELLLQIKENYPNTKVVIMTAYGSSDVQKEATNRGCFQYIEKPFEINDLQQIIFEGLYEQNIFKANVSDFQLSDIIQLNCLGRLTVSLNVKHGNEVGTIHFKNGNIVHAEKGDLVGEAAFYHIMEWQTGEFSVSRNVSTTKETIQSSWQSLLLESLKRAGRDSNIVAEDQNDEMYWQSVKIESLLSRLRNAEGVRHILINSHEGKLIFYSGEFDREPEKITELGTEIFHLMKSFEKAKKMLNHQSLQFWEVQLENDTMFINKIPFHHAFLTIIGNSEINPGLVRLEIKKLLPLVAQLL